MFAICFAVSYKEQTERQPRLYDEEGLFARSYKAKKNGCMIQ